MVADSLMYHPQVAHFQKFVGTTVGRDKFLRTLQYFARFYAWFLLRNNASKAELLPWSTLKSQLSLARKAFRLGKFVEHFTAASKAFDIKATSTSETFMQYTMIGRQLGYAGYMLCDNLAFLDALGAWKSERGKEMGVRAYQFWLVGLVCSVVGGVYKTAELRMRESEVNRSQGEGAVEMKMIQRERAAVSTQFLSDVCDITIPASALGYGGGYLDDGVVGLAGTVGSLLGLASQWAKTA